VNAIVKDVMTTDVISVREDAPFEAIAAALRQRRVSAVPVIDDLSRVIGVVSESDLLAKLALGVDDDEGPASWPTRCRPIREPWTCP
jgi:CBS domain-containing protein